MSASRDRRVPPVHLSHIRRLKGRATVHAVSDRSGEGTVFRVGYISGGGDISFLSIGTSNEDHARACACLLAEFFGATVDGDITEWSRPSVQANQGVQNFASPGP